MNEKRSYPRLSREWEIEFQMPVSKSSQPILFKSGIRDLGMGGFSFRSGFACPPEALFHFVLTPKDSLKPMVGVAQIAWTRGQEGVYDSGAHFVWVSWEGMDPQTAIGQYVVDHISKKPS
ncbi:MAG: PilZ domain-containing protein [Candidatus Aminicenantales bacterium]|jgi:hypothetical protein